MVRHIVESCTLRNHNRGVLGIDLGGSAADEWLANLDVRQKIVIFSYEELFYTFYLLHIYLFIHLFIFLFYFFLLCRLY
jgi:hypothetical protein